SVVYEVFLDRFASSGAGRPLPPWGVARGWDERPDPHTRNPHHELYGGDLAGLQQHLDHVESLGANVLYLTPVFPAASNHRYDPASFARVDEFLGGREALDALVHAARGRGMHVVGDLSLDHPGNTHEWFKLAAADPSAEERAFFLFDRAETHGYVGWLGY